MYVIKKDGLYLMNYMYNGIREMVNGEELTDVPTAIYCNNIKDAQLYGSHHQTRGIDAIAGAGVGKQLCRQVVLTFL